VGISPAPGTPLLAGLARRHRNTRIPCTKNDALKSFGVVFQCKPEDDLGQHHDSRASMEMTTMSTYSKIHPLVLLLLLAIPSTLIAASIPDELIGGWSASTDDFCGIKFTSKGYTGSADGEGYKCDVKNVRELFKEFSENPMWRMVFVCEGEFGTVQVNSLIRLQTIKGVRFMAHVETLSPKDVKKATVEPVSILYKCP
jgi:hypothetical protein